MNINTINMSTSTGQISLSKQTSENFTNHVAIKVLVPATEENEEPIPWRDRAKNNKAYVPEKANTGTQKET